MAIPAGSERWVEVTPSQFPHEQEGLELLRIAIPDQAPYRVWSNFEFRDGHGNWHEVDALVLAPDGLHLLELKYYSGTLTGNDSSWLRNGRAEDSPLKLARRKAQRLATKLTTELDAWTRETGVQIPSGTRPIPFISQAVFLHHPALSCRLRPESTMGLYGPDGAEATTGLRGISTLLGQPPRKEPVKETLLVKLLARIGLVQRREREAGSWRILDEALGDGPDWQDWRAEHRLDAAKARIRFRPVPTDASKEQVTRARELAMHEHRTTRRLHHDGILSSLDLVEAEELGHGVVYPLLEDEERLDLWLAARPEGITLESQLSILRQIADALHYAHGSHVVHRQLTPACVWVRAGRRHEGQIRLRISSWEVAGASGDTTVTTSARAGVTALAAAADPNDAARSPDADPDAGNAAYEAPEGAWSPRADRVRLDVFGWGAVAHHVLVGTAPAASRPQLLERLRQQDGLDISPQLPQVSPDLRALILNATRPVVSKRLRSMGDVVQALDTVEKQSRGGDAAPVDALDARAGDVLDGRFEVISVLGRGSTAKGLLVNDLTDPKREERVLKVALSAEAATRLDGEAETLRAISSPLVVSLIEGPVTVGGRQVLVLESAGRTTLADQLLQRDRLSIDYVERFGTDLLDALVHLDAVGVDHRDIKPANLGVIEGRGRKKHLILFDFSLTGAAASAVEAGTPPYLDPFLGVGSRTQFDSAAERYAASVVLFEMSTGTHPVYGDGLSHPSMTDAGPTVEAAQFDPALAPRLVPFFRRALDPDAAKRHHTASDMRAEWVAIFTQAPTTKPDDRADALAEAATLTTPLETAGLSARALSALEPLRLHSVGDLLAVDQVRISNLAGVADRTRRDVRARIKEWRARLGTPTSPSLDPQLRLEEVADVLLGVAQRARSASTPGVLRLILGVGTDLDAFASHAALAAALIPPVTPARVTQIIADLQDRWAQDPEARVILQRASDAVEHALGDLGVATIDGLTEAVIASVEIAHTAVPDELRRAQGLLRLAIERLRIVAKGDEEGRVEVRRREGRVVLVATDPALFDRAERLGDELSTLYAAASQGGHDALLSAPRVERTLAAIHSDIPLARRAALAVAAAPTLELSAAGEVHHRDLPASVALAATLRGMGAGQRLKADEIRGRVRSRFPALAPLPQRPRLDELVDEAHVGLHFDMRVQAYVTTAAAPDTTGLVPRSATRLASLPADPHSIEVQRFARVLAASARERSFLALSVGPDVRPSRLQSVLVADHNAEILDVTAELIAAMKSVTAQTGPSWTVVQAADAAEVGSRAHRGLTAVVDRAMPVLLSTLRARVRAGGGPLVLVDAGPLARYGHLAALTEVTDLSSARARAVWLVVPSSTADRGGSMLDGVALPLSAPAQFVSVERRWVDARAAAVAAAVSTTLAKEHPPA